MSPVLDAPAAGPALVLADLQRQLAARTAERDAALAREAATGQVLDVINASQGDLAPVFEAMLERAVRLCEGAQGVLWTIDGERVKPTATHRIAPKFLAILRQCERPEVGPPPPLREIMAGTRVIQIDDAAEHEFYRSDTPLAKAAVEHGLVRSLVWVGLFKNGRAVGAFAIARREVRPFSDRQVTLLEHFAAQAVIAMENARLLGELRQRTRDLEESLEYQTATSDVLNVISRSTFDLAPVLETVIETAIRLCRAHMGSIFRLEDGLYRWAVGYGLDPVYREIEKRTPLAPGPDTLVGRVALEGRTVQIVDAQADPLYARKNEAAVTRACTMLGVPLMREGVPTGVIALARDHVEPFDDKEIALVATFADQAVIAIENARLLTETREALEQQTATAEVLQVINSSPGDLHPVFDAMLEKAIRLCDAVQGTLWLIDGGRGDIAASQGLPPEFIARLRASGATGENPLLQRVASGERLIHFVDTAAEEVYRSGDPIARAAVAANVRSLVWVTLVKEGVPVGAFAIARREARPFSDKQIKLLQNFAAQAVIAMENARLLTEIRAARDAAEKALGELKATQQQLVVQQKMAALGQLTAGIAHEIKNPLNFVNNFAGLSVELLNELKEAAAPGLAALDDNARAEIDDTFDILTSNLDKIAEHGRRADGIVKSMLAHSRGSSGERQAVDLNALIDEALNLAYHGARAQDQSFNISMEREFAPRLAPIEVVPQDMTRVFLNLIGNGFYAAHKRGREAGDGYRPVLKVTTCDLGDAVEVRVRDNGTGISVEHRERLFQPFFTTKPTGEGTGLGLSISYDIVTQQHGGTITVDSQAGAFTEFTVRLPRGRQRQTGGGVA